MFERLICWMFGHAWRYYEPAAYTNAYSSNKTQDFSKRKCIRCDTIEECLYKNNYNDKWRRIE